MTAYDPATPPQLSRRFFVAIVTLAHYETVRAQFRAVTLYPLPAHHQKAPGNRVRTAAPQEGYTSHGEWRNATGRDRT